MKNKTQKLVFIGLLISMGVVLAQFLSIALPPSQTIYKIGIGYLPLIIISIVFGPYYGLISGLIQDSVGFILWGMSQGVYHFGFTFNALLIGVIPWLIFHFRFFKPVVYKRFNLGFIAIIFILSVYLIFHIDLVTSRIPYATNFFSYVLIASSMFSLILLGIFLYRTKAIDENHLLIFIVIVVIFVTSILLTPIWVGDLYSLSYWIQLPPRIVKFPFEIIVYSIFLIRIFDLFKKKERI